MSTVHSSIDLHPDILALRAGYDRVAESMAAQVTFGLTLLTAMYVALSPWIVGFDAFNRLTVNDPDRRRGDRVPVNVFQLCAGPRARHDLDTADLRCVADHLAVGVCQWADRRHDLVARDQRCARDGAGLQRDVLRDAGAQFRSAARLRPVGRSGKPAVPRPGWWGDLRQTIVFPWPAERHILGNRRTPMTAMAGTNCSDEAGGAGRRTGGDPSLPWWARNPPRRGDRR